MIDLFGELMPPVVEAAPAENRVAVRFKLGRGPEGETCRTCGRKLRKTWDKTYWKCTYWDTNCASSDIRLKWRACGRWISDRATGQDR